MPTLRSLFARQILDSRGNPTVEVECALSNGVTGRAAVPSGVSAGIHEALELRDNDPTKFCGKSVLKAVNNVNTVIAEGLGTFDIADQRELDRSLLEMDGTPNKSKLGANAILGVSMAVAVARAGSERRSLFLSLADQFGEENPVLLPIPLMVLIEGGAHSDSGLSFQECMIVPTGFSRFSEALRAGVETFQTLKKILHQAHNITAVGDEGAFAARVKTGDAACTLLVQAIDAAGYTGKIQIALDAAASEFYSAGHYTLDGKELSVTDLTDEYEKLCTKYPILSIEDSHAEDDWEGFSQMRKRLGDQLQLVGDDLLVTSTGRIHEAIDRQAVNAVLIKVNQIGTVTETVDAIELTQVQGWNAIISHRGGDTEDTFIADLAVGLRTGQIKTGSLSRSERTAKYNQLLRIEEELGESAQYVNPFA